MVQEGTTGRLGWPDGTGRPGGYPLLACNVMAAALGLFLIALAARAVAAAIFGEPAYPDSFYYVNVARQFAAGNGFSVDYIWNFVDVGGRLPADPRLPIPSNAHWMPLAVLVQVPFIWLLGPTALASALPFWICGAIAAPLCWLIAREAGLGPGAALGAGLLAAMPGAAAPFLVQPDNFALFLPLGALCLLACGRALRGDRRWFAVGGVAVGLATLSRNDGVLLGVPFALAFLADLVRRTPGAARVGWRAAFLCGAGFLLVTAPWWARQLDVFGSISPSGSSGRILWITDYRELYSIGGEPPTLSTFLAQGAGSIIVSRAAGLASALTIFTAVPLLFFLAPFTLVGAWLRRGDATFVPWLIYGATLFGFSALLFAVHVPHGTFLHSAVALLPHAYVLALLGLAATVRWVAARKPAWDARRATGVFTGACVVVALAGGAVGSTLVMRGWQREHELRDRLSTGLAAAPAEDRLMSPDAGAYRYHADRSGIVTPDDPLPIVETAMRAYDVRWLVLERDHITAALAPLLLGRERPSWLSAPVVTVAGEGPTAAPRGALYAVCFAPDDERCAS